MGIEKYDAGHLVVFVCHDLSQQVHLLFRLIHFYTIYSTSEGGRAAASGIERRRTRIV